MLLEIISEKTKEAMRAGRETEVGVFRMALAVLKNKEIEKRGRSEEALTQDEEIEILRKEVKKRKESAEMFQNGGRNDLAEKENEEIKILKSLLPEELSPEKIEEIVIAAIKKIVPQGPKDFGRVMAEAMKETGGRADSSVIAEAIKKNIAA